MIQGFSTELAALTGEDNIAIFIGYCDLFASNKAVETLDHVVWWRRRVASIGSRNQS